MTDLRALIAQLCDELDHNRRCLLDDRRLTHPLSDKARAALVETDGPAVSGDREPASVAKQSSGELSPAAQAVLDATEQDGKIIYGMPLLRPLIAAALRAVADQVVPEESTKNKMFIWQRERLEQRLMTRKHILAIANNLEAQ